jgi:adenylate cyclase
MKLFKKEYKSVYTVTIVLTMFFLILYMIDFGLSTSLVLSELENKWHDTKFGDTLRLLRKAYIIPPLKKADERILIVGIDNKTLLRYGWPMPRIYYKPLIENLNKYGVKVIGLDIMFVDRDRTEPKNDIIFSETVKKNKNVVIAVSLDENGNINLPIKELRDNTTNFASISAGMMLDVDGKIRRVYPFITEIIINGKNLTFSYKDICNSCDDLKNVGLPLLGTYLYSYYSGVDLKELYKKWHNEYGDRSLILNFRESKFNSSTVMYDYVSAKDVIEDSVDEKLKKRLKDAIVIVGSVAQGTFDHYPTSIHQQTPGVEIHALCIDNLLNDDYLRNVKFYIFLPVFLLAIWLPVLLIKKSVLKLSLYNFLFDIIILWLSIVLIKLRYDFYFAVYFIVNLVSYIYVIAYKSIVEDRQKRWIKNTFSQYLSPDVVNIIVSDPSKLKLGGEKKDMTVFFMDIAGFTSISERLSPEEVTNLLNTYLSELSDIILSKRGVIDKYIGDCIMAFWNAPLDIPDHRTLAVKSALECLEKIKELNIKCEIAGGINVRIGINSGSAVVGNMGSNRRFSYTVLGDTVNLASRLEGANKFFNTSCMVSDDVYAEAKQNVIFNYIGDILVVGKNQPIRVWRPFKLKDKMDENDNEFVKNYDDGIKYFYSRDYKNAHVSFEKAYSIINDNLCKFYMSQSEKFIKDGDSDFNGVFNIKSK